MYIDVSAYWFFFNLFYYGKNRELYNELPCSHNPAYFLRPTNFLCPIAILKQIRNISPVNILVCISRNQMLLFKNTIMPSLYLSLKNQ